LSSSVAGFSENVDRRARRNSSALASPDGLKGGAVPATTGTLPPPPGTDKRSEMRTGNAILDIVIQVAVVAIIAALLVWILGMVGAPSIISTIIWILAVIAIILILLQLLRGRRAV
jgi:hypothetical protein